MSSIVLVNMSNAVSANYSVVFAVVATRSVEWKHRLGHSVYYGFSSKYQFGYIDIYMR